MPLTASSQNSVVKGEGWTCAEREMKKHRHNCLAASTIPMADHRDPWEPLLDTSTHGESSFTLLPTKSRLNCVALGVPAWKSRGRGHPQTSLQGGFPTPKLQHLYLVTHSVSEIPEWTANPILSNFLLHWILPWAFYSLNPFKPLPSKVQGSVLLVPIVRDVTSFFLSPSLSEKVVNVSIRNSVMTYEATLRSGLSKYKK